MIAPFKGKTPSVSDTVFVAADASVIGDVSIDQESSVFFGAVLRGDLEPIRVGSRTNIQEHSLLHTSHGRSPVIIEDEVTIGHRAIIHGARIENRVLIGMGAIVLDDAIIGEESLIAAGTLITERQKIPPRSLVMGIPGKVVRQLEDTEIKNLKASAVNYVKTSREFLSAGIFSAHS